MLYNPIDAFGITCPEGGAFYVCENCEIQFLGCCASDPVEDGSGVSNSQGPLHSPEKFTPVTFTLPLASDVYEAAAHEKGPRSP